MSIPEVPSSIQADVSSLVQESKSVTGSLAQAQSELQQAKDDLAYARVENHYWSTTMQTLFILALSLIMAAYVWRAHSALSYKLFVVGVVAFANFCSIKAFRFALKTLSQERNLRKRHGYQPLR